jgi:predicted Co/Zn/Cd cation transporter (cation efflux family)
VSRTALGRVTLLVLTVHVLHDLDHVRQGESASSEVVVAAILGWIWLIALAVLVARGHRLAPPVAVAYGIASAAGFVLVHFLPRWSAFSAPYGEVDADALSWVLAALPVGAGLLLAAQAAAALREDGRAGSASSVLRNA